MKPDKIKNIKPNFQCLDCGHRMYVQQYSTVIRNGRSIFKDKYGLLFKCLNAEIANIGPHDPEKSNFAFIAPKKGVPELMGTQGGTFKSEKELLLDKQKKRKIRARHHFKNEMLEKHKDPAMIPHFRKKYKGTKFVDHEKL